MSIDDEVRAVAKVVDRVADRFPDVPREQVEQTVREEHDAFRTCAVRDYVLILVERRVRDRLRQNHPDSRSDVV